MLEVQTVNSIPSNRECLTRSVNGKTVVNNRGTYQRVYLLVSIRIDFSVCIYWLEFISSNFELQRSERKKQQFTYIEQVLGGVGCVTNFLLWRNELVARSYVPKLTLHEVTIHSVFAFDIVAFDIALIVEPILKLFPKMTLTQLPIFGFFPQDSQIGIKDRIPRNCLNFC